MAVPIFPKSENEFDVSDEISAYSSEDVEDQVARTVNKDGYPNKIQIRQVQYYCYFTATHSLPRHPSRVACGTWSLER